MISNLIYNYITLHNLYFNHQLIALEAHVLIIKHRVNLMKQLAKHIVHSRF